jgi:single-strand DNA-binding protein
MNEIPANFAGNLTRDPELRFTQSGQAVAAISVAVTPRRYNVETKTYEDGTTSYIEASVWGSQAQNVVDSLVQGDRVVVTGRFVTRTYTPEQGRNAGHEVRKLEVVVDELGTSLRWATAKPVKTTARAGDEAPASEEPPF